MKSMNSCPCHRDNYKKGRNSAVKYLVIHYVGALGSAAANARYYGTTPGIGASAHYFVGHAAEGAAVWSSVPEGDTAWHVGAKRYVHPECRNGNSIGVELCCHRRADGTWYFDRETVDAAVALCRDIVGRYGLDRAHVLRHYDVTHKKCPAPFVDDVEAWLAFKKRIFEEERTMDEPAGWAKEAWEKAADRKVLDGTRPGEPVTRQELAAVMDRLGLLG